MPSSVQFSSYSLQSYIRETNQDLFWPEPDSRGNFTHPIDSNLLDDRGHLFVVATGSGQPPHGLAVCRLAVQTLVQSYYNETLFHDVSAKLLASLQAANQAVYDYNALREWDERVLGNSIVAAVINEDKITIANVGFCGAYLVRGMHVEKLIPLGLSIQLDDRSPDGHEYKYGLGYQVPLLVRADATEPYKVLQLSPYLEVISDRRVKHRDVLILVSDCFVGLEREGGRTVLDDIQHGLDTTIAHRLAQTISQSSPMVNMTVTAVWLSEPETES